MNYLNINWKNELALNNEINQKLNEYCKDYGIVIRKNGLHWPHRGRPDGVGSINNTDKLIIEYKLIRTYSNTCQRAACQDLCYTYDKYKNGIVPIKLHLIITEKEIIGINFNNYEFIYDNFGLIREQYNKCSACKFYDSCKEVRELLQDIKQLANFVIPMNNVDFTQLATTIHKMVA